MKKIYSTEACPCREKGGDWHRKQANWTVWIDNQNWRAHYNKVVDNAIILYQI